MRTLRMAIFGLSRNSRMNRFLLLAIVATAPLSLAACGGTSNSTMDTGQRISERGGEISNYGDAWADGQKNYRQGQSMVEKSNKKAADAEKALVRARADMQKAEDNMRAAQADRASGEQLMSTGTSRMQQAEADYTAIRQGPPATGPDY